MSPFGPDTDWFMATPNRGSFGFPHTPRGPRARRGDVRTAILALLAEGPHNGYQLIQQIAQRSGGFWQPSPGSVYPALAQLESEGLVEADSADDRRRTWRLTETGQVYVEEHADDLGAPWAALTAAMDTEAIELRSLIGQLAAAAFQVMSAGTDDQIAEVRKLLTETRRSLYRLLAEE